MKNEKRLSPVTKILVVISLVLLLTSCKTFTTGLDTSKTLDFTQARVGKACGHYFLGSIDASWVGVIGFRFSGEESATLAAQDAGITSPFAVEYDNTNWILYTRKCVIVRGHGENLEPPTKIEIN
jgi:hypothetical protein